VRREDLEESELVRLARRAIEAWVEEGRVLRPDEGPLLNEFVGSRAGTFVSLKKHGNLRGCIGTIMPTRPSVAEEIIRNAISSSTQDPRFPPVTRDELEDLEISVDVLGEPEPVSDISQLDPREFGVIVRSGPRVGLLLPDLEGVDSVEEQVEIARRKAGIPPGEPLEIQRFRVKRYK
jgi:AmmeMemoRadiSam system protein A